MIAKWFQSTAAHRPFRMAGSIAGIAVTIAFISAIGAFITYSGRSMTARAIGELPVDWQIQLAPGADEKAVEGALRATTAYTALSRVSYADVGGFVAKTEGSVQTTGAGKVVGIGSEYRRLFPGQLRALTGAPEGVLVTQQAAANLHVRPGDSVEVLRIGLPPATVRVDGLVDLPRADSFFQSIGLLPNAAPQAPPDNVILVPEALWQGLFAEQALLRPDSVRLQLHVKIGHGFPSDPNLACVHVQELAHNLEARIAGGGAVGNNLFDQLSAVRENALYSNILFLFLGLPGTILAILLVLFIAASGERQRERERRLLRAQGASMGRVLRLEEAEALGTGICGVLAGTVLSYFAAGMVIPRGPATIGLVSQWVAFASVAGLVLALVAVIRPALRTGGATTGEEGREPSRPVWKRIYLDLVLLAASAIEFLRVARSGYAVVLAPEGATALSVNYEAFIAPFCLWVGGVLLGLRVFEGLVAGKRGFVSALIRPTARGLSPLVAASLSRDRKYLTRGMLLVSLAFSFAVSTSIFNTTYTRQARVDAELTNGADVTLTGIAPFTRDDSRVQRVSALPGIAGMQPMLHRFAYVGNDLQDLYGIDPRHIQEATNMADAYFGNKDAKGTLASLERQADGVLVSEETVRDFQLRKGDLVNLRLQSGKDHAYHVIPFHFVGVVREFPTAPKDSFLVANAGYIASMTENASFEILLLRAGSSSERLARQVGESLGSAGPAGVAISDIGSAQRTIDSGLTSVDLHGLTSFELLFAALSLACSLGLVLALGMAERRRNFAILTIIGAGKREVDAFIGSECLVISAGGIVWGGLLGLGEAQVLVKILSGVFDPPPETLALPWGYLGALLLTAVASLALAESITSRLTRRRPAIEEVRLLS